MQTQRPLNSVSNIARDGAPKKLTDPEIVKGQVRQTKPSHEFLHGQTTIDDEAPAKSFEGKGAEPLHPGMIKHSDEFLVEPFRGDHERTLGDKVLADADFVKTPKRK